MHGRRLSSANAHGNLPGCSSGHQIKFLINRNLAALGDLNCVATSGLGIVRDGTFLAINLSGDNALGTLPAGLSLTSLNLHGMASVSIGQILCHDLCISGTDVGLVSSLAALLQLCCENGDCDGYQHGR